MSGRTADPEAAALAGVGGSVDWLRRCVAAMFAATLLLSPGLWLTARDYPLTPVWDGLPQPPFPFDYVLLVLMLVALAGAVVLSTPRWALWMVCGIGALWALLDQSRWQPFLVHYLVLLGCLLLVPWTRRGQWSVAVLQWVLAPCRLLLAFTYFYSGLHKLNHNFATGFIAWTAGAFGFEAESFSGPAPSVLNIAIALAESLAGALLLMRRTCRGAALFLMGMHVFIMLVIGPLGYHINLTVWPWNVAMVVALWHLFCKRGAISETQMYLSSRSWWCQVVPFRSQGAGPGIRNSLAIAVVVVFCGVLPLLNFWELWDDYLSFALYTGNYRKSTLIIRPADLAVLPASVGAAKDERGQVDIEQWALNELGAMIYPEDRIAINIGRTLARQTVRGPVYVRIVGKAQRLTGKRRVKRICCPAGGGEPVEMGAGLIYHRGRSGGCQP